MRFSIFQIKIVEDLCINILLILEGMVCFNKLGSLKDHTTKNEATKVSWRNTDLVLGKITLMLTRESSIMSLYISYHYVNRSWTPKALTLKMIIFKYKHTSFNLYTCIAIGKYFESHP